MKKVLSALVLTSLLVMPMVTLAAYEGETSPNQPEEIISSGQDLVDLINNVGNWIFTILLAIAAIFLVVAGFMFVTAGGNPENTTKARQMLINALIGVAVALGAKGLVAVVTSLLGASA